MAFTQQQINDALVAELAARPGTTYEQMLAHATSTYGLTPGQVTEAYNAMSRAGNTVLVNTGEDGGPGTLHVDPGTVVDTTWWPDTPVYDPSRPPGSTNTSTGNNTNINTRVNTATTDLPLPAQLQRMNVDFGDGTAAVNPNWQNRVTVGAAGDDMIGVGDADYNSALIRNLRSASAQERSNNPGVSMIPNGAAGSSGPGAFTGSGGYAMNDIISALRSELAARPGSSYDALYNMANSAYGVNRNAFNDAYRALGLSVPASGGNALSPDRFSLDRATQKEIDDYNAYSAYRTGVLRSGSNANILSFADWLEQRDNPDADLPGLLDDVANVAKAGLGLSDGP